MEDDKRTWMEINGDIRDIKETIIENKDEMKRLRVETGAMQAERKKENWKLWIS